MSALPRRRTAALAVLVALLTGGAASGSASAAPHPGPAPDLQPSAGDGRTVVRAPVEDLVLRAARRTSGSDGTDRRTASAVAAEPLTVVPGVPGPPVSTWKIDYVGVGGSTWTQPQRDAFDAAVRTWAGIVASPVDITVTARMQDLGEPDLLGETTPVLLCQDDDQPCLPSALMNAQAGVDVHEEAPDLEASFNSGYLCDGRPGFSYRLDGQVPACQVDFSTVVLHELAHGLGFTGSMSVEPGDVGTYWTPHDRWDDFVSDADGRLIDAPSGTTALADRLQGGALRWTGAWGKRANGGRAPSLYAPAVFAPGSSYSHLDEATYPQGTPDSLMTPMLNTREVVREPGSLARGVLRDLGWTVTPERGERGAWSSTAGAVDVAQRRADGSLDLRTWTSGGLSRATLLGGRVKGAPAVVRRPSGELEVFVRGSDDALWTRRLTGRSWSSWTSLGGRLSSSPAVSRRSGHELHVFVRGADGAVWTRSSADAASAWGSWTGLGGALAPGSSPGAVSPRTGTIELVFSAPDGSVRRRTLTTRWGTEASLGGRTTGSPSVTSLGGTLLVAVTGTDRAVWTRTPTTRWTSAGGAVVGSPALAAAPGSTTATLLATGTGSDARLYVNSLTLAGTGAAPTASGWTAGQP